MKDELKRLSLAAFRLILGCEQSRFYFRSRSFTLCLSDLYYVMDLTEQRPVHYGELERKEAGSERRMPRCAEAMVRTTFGPAEGECKSLLQGPSTG